MDIATTERRLTAVEDRAKSNTHRLDKVEERQADLETLVTSVAEMASELKNIKGDVDEVKADLKTLTGKAGKRWENIVDRVLSIVVGALIGYVLLRLGLPT